MRALAAGDAGETGVMLWGAPGAGKTHLLRAAVAAVEARGGSGRVSSRSPGELLAQDPDALAERAVVAIDGIDRATPDAQARLFTLFNGLRERGGHLLVASRLPLAALPLREDLRTRLGWGLVYEITPLADADKPARAGRLRPGTRLSAGGRRHRLPAGARPARHGARSSARWPRSTGIRSPPSGPSRSRCSGPGCSATSTSIADVQRVRAGAATRDGRYAAIRSAHRRPRVNRGRQAALTAATRRPCRRRHRMTSGVNAHDASTEAPAGSAKAGARTAPETRTSQAAAHDRADQISDRSPAGRRKHGVRIARSTRKSL